MTSFSLINNVINNSSMTTEIAMNATAVSSTLDYNASCDYYKAYLTFNSAQLARVIASWILFLISSFGNIFILWCLYTTNTSQRSHVHTITLHLTLADLAYTFFSIPVDTTWIITSAWLGGEALCKFCQFLKQFGMYISSIMVLVVALDRCFSILLPMVSSPQLERRTTFLLIGAWLSSFLSAIPSAFLFSITRQVFCLDKPVYTQCVDFALVPAERLTPYYFFTMGVSFVIPMVVAVISYSLVICEITNMLKRDQRLMGRRESNNQDLMVRARRKTLVLTSLVTLTFALLWGPYYGLSTYMWFNRAKPVSEAVSNSLFALMYVHPAVHPLIYGVFIADVRKKFCKMISCIFFCFRCSSLTRESKNHKMMNPIKFFPFVKKETVQRKSNRPFRAMSEPVTSCARIGKSMNTSVIYSEPIRGSSKRINVFLREDRGLSRAPNDDVSVELLDEPISVSSVDVSSKAIDNGDVNCNSYVGKTFSSNGNCRAEFIPDTKV